MKLAVPNGACIEFVRIERAGEQPFWMSKTKVTQQQWRAVMGSNPSEVQCDSNPVESVTWADAVQFCRKATELTAHTIQLPLSDEWSIAFGVRRAVDGKIHTWQSVEEVKTWNRPPAVDGMMEGIKEWCADWFRFSSGHGTSPPIRFVRGGKPFEGEVDATGYEPDTAMPFIGFRVVTGGNETLREAEMARRPPRPIEAHILIAEPLTLSPDMPEVRSRKGVILKLVEVDPSTASVRITLNDSIVKAMTGQTVGGLRVKSVTSNKVEIELLSCEVNEP